MTVTFKSTDGIKQFVFCDVGWTHPILVEGLNITRRLIFS